MGGVAPWQRLLWAKARRGPWDGGLTVVSNVLGAAARALLVMMLIATPGLMLPPDADTVQMTVLVCIVGGALIFAEYAAVYPGFISFRDMAPFNRVRFVAVFTTLFGLCAIAQQMQGGASSLGVVLAAVGGATTALFDLPLSPTTLMAAALEPHIGVDIARALAGWAALWAMGTMAAFIAVVQALRWPPDGEELNLWVNLPLFGAANEDEVVDKLRQGACVNFVLGSTLPFILPFLILAVAPALWFTKSGSEQLVVWLVTIWAMAPTICWMRGLACLRISDVVANRRVDGGEAYASS